ncbi:hypothetical protein N8Z64_06940 [Pseudomonadales bacterium]|nr:hypothetical protein [Pseudomonadales bacterium]
MIIYNASAKGATGLDQCRFSSKGASFNTAPYQSRISIATGFFRRKLLSPQASFAASFFRRRLLSPQASFAAGFFRRRRYPFTIPIKGFKPAEPLLD